MSDELLQSLYDESFLTNTNLKKSCKTLGLKEEEVQKNEKVKSKAKKIEDLLTQLVSSSQANEKEIKEAKDKIVFLTNKLEEEKKLNEELQKKEEKNGKGGKEVVDENSKKLILSQEKIIKEGKDTIANLTKKLEFEVKKCEVLEAESKESGKKETYTVR